MPVPNRCRLVLVIPDALPDADKALSKALEGGDVASIILAKTAGSDGNFQQFCQPLVHIAQTAGVAAVIANDTQAAGRCNADGIHVDLPGGDAGVPQLRELIAKFSPAMMVGGGAVKSRHMALSLGETNPDYLFFGKLDSDIKSEPHAKMLALAEWWAEMVEVPGICMGGSEVDSIIDVATTGIDFAALSSAIFSHNEGPKEAVKLANELLDKHAPEFEDV